MSQRSLIRAATAAILLCAGLPAIRAQEPAASAAPALPSAPAAPSPSATPAAAATPATAALALGVGATPTPAPASLFTPPPTEAAPAPKPDATVENSVVKIFATARYPDPYRPWTKQAPKDFTGSGAVIGNHRILTNAHVVLYASQIQVQANQAGRQTQRHRRSIRARHRPRHFKTRRRILLRHPRPAAPWPKTLPDIKDAVMVYGYPEGGYEPVHHEGDRLAHRVRAVQPDPSQGLRIQVDSAINPGNSAAARRSSDGKMIGLAFSKLAGGAENIGYIIPGEEIELFLNGHRGRQIRRQARHLRRGTRRWKTRRCASFLKLDKAVAKAPSSIIPPATPPITRSRSGT